MSNPTTIKKNSVVRVNFGEDHKLFGELGVVLSIRNDKATGVTRVEIRSLNTGLIHILPMAELALAANINVVNTNLMDEAVAKRAEAAEAKRKEYVAAKLKARDEKVATALSEDLAWAAAAPTVNERHSGQMVDSAWARIEVVGPNRVRDGKDIGPDVLSVEASLRLRDGWHGPEVPAIEERGVNWAACGTVSPAMARAYAKAILLAADAAERLTLAAKQD